MIYYSSNYSFRSVQNINNEYETQSSMEPYHYSKSNLGFTRFDLGKMSPNLQDFKINYDFSKSYIVNNLHLDRKGSQMHRLRRNFESERKANRNNFYKSIVRNEHSAETMIDKFSKKRQDNNTEIKPR